MLFSFVFMALLSNLVFAAFVLINKSQLDTKEKLSSKQAILILFGLVILMNNLQIYEQQSKSTKLSGIFSTQDLVPLCDACSEIDYFNSTEINKAVYVSDNTTFFQQLALYLDTNNVPHAYLNVNYDSALILDAHYRNQVFSKLNQKINQEQLKAFLLVRLHLLDESFLSGLEELFEQTSLVLYIEKKDRNLGRYFYQFRIQL